MAYKYPICDVFHWFCKIARFFATEPEYLNELNDNPENVDILFNYGIFLLDRKCNQKAIEFIVLFFPNSQPNVVTSFYHKRRKQLLPLSKIQLKSSTFLQNALYIGVNSPYCMLFWLI